MDVNLSVFAQQNINYDNTCKCLFQNKQINFFSHTFKPENTATRNARLIKVH